MPFCFCKMHLGESQVVAFLPLCLIFPHKLQIKVPQTVLPPPGETVDQGGDLVGGARRLRHLLFNQAEGRALVRYFNGEPLVQYVPGNIICNNMCGRCEFDERLLAKAGIRPK